MKLSRKKVISSTALAALIMSQAMPTFAATYPSETQGKSDVSVEFEENSDGGGVIVDPTDPNNVVTPDPGTTNPKKGSLVLNYVSDFKFNTQKIDWKNATYYAKLTEINGTEMPNFVSVEDTRGTNAGWKLTVTQDEQLKANNEKLEGAIIKIKNSKAVGAAGYTTNEPTVYSEVALTPGSANPVATANQGKGMGSWTMSFGKDNIEGAKSIELHVPGQSAKVKNSQYATTLTWDLADAP